MSNQPLQEDTSMEELLTTIRSVIAGGDAASPESKKPTSATVPSQVQASSPSFPQDDDEVLELTDVLNEDGSVTSLTHAPALETRSIPTPETTQHSTDSISAATDVLDHIDKAVAQTPFAKTEKSHRDDRQSKSSGLLTEEAINQSADAIRDLVTTFPKFQQSGIHFRSGSTMEDLVIEALKPELGKWLNEHLPGLVKQIVEKEIRRLIPQAEDTHV
ncbi:MAG: DUF2497 domain-containing protein [Alphaproteobacteria bacterium]|nr:DUF2497 domain-containing protein [Alphaproteobacteria bacterium]